MSNINLDGFSQNNKISKVREVETEELTKKRVSFLENDNKALNDVAEILSKKETTNVNLERLDLNIGMLGESNDILKTEKNENEILKDLSSSQDEHHPRDNSKIQEQIILEEDEIEDDMKLSEANKISLTFDSQIDSLSLINKTANNLQNNSSMMVPSKIMDFSIVSRSQQRLSPIHINNRKYPIIDYMNDSNNQFNTGSSYVINDRSMLIASPSKKNYSKISLLKEDYEEENSDEILATFFKEMNIQYFEELPEYLSNNKNSLLLDPNFYKQNDGIKLFINNEDLHSLSQESVYLSLYTKTPILEIDRFIINELNSKLESSLSNFNKINSDYNDPENKAKLPFLLQHFKSLKQDFNYYEKLIKLIAVLKKNCDLESQKIWLNWRIQQFDGISLVLNDNLLIVKEQFKELTGFKKKLLLILRELINFKELGTFQQTFNSDKNMFIQNNQLANNTFNKSFIREEIKIINENVKTWENKRQLLLKKYDIDIGDINKITKSKQKELIEQIKQKKKENISFSNAKLNSKEIKQNNNSDLTKIFKKYMIQRSKVLYKNENFYKVEFENIPNLIFLVKLNEKQDNVQSINFDSLKEINNSEFLKLWVLNEFDLFINTFNGFTKTSSKLKYLCDQSKIFLTLKKKFTLIKNTQTIQVNHDSRLISFVIWLNNNMGYIKVNLDWSKFKQIANNNYDLLKELQHVTEKNIKDTKTGVFLYFYGKGFDWEKFIPKYISEIVNIAQ
ncbi:hypothetical protein QEN19_000517 [Hanseniaspora menglaensis]